ncbi:MAG: universal stress protein, partial [Phormidesmis sp.]
LLMSPSEIKTILIPIENPSVMTLRVLRFAQVLATTNSAKITLLHVCGPRTSEVRRARLKKQMEVLIDRLPPAPSSIEIEILARDNVVMAIAKAARQYDLVIVRSQRRRSSNGFTLGTQTTPLVQQLSGSLMLVGEPHTQPTPQPTRRAIAAKQLSTQSA